MLRSIKGLHTGEPFVETVFSGDLVASWEVIDFLEPAKTAVDV